MLNKLKRISKLLSRYLLLIFVLTLISVSVFLRNLKMVMIEYVPIKKTDSLFSAIRIVLMDKNYSSDYGFIISKYDFYDWFYTFCNSNTMDYRR